MREVRIENIRLICGDCMEAMREFLASDGRFSEATPFDLAVCDPDYGLNRKLRGGNYMARYGKSGMEMGGKPTQEWLVELRKVSCNQIVWGWNYFDFLPPTRCFLVWHKKDGPKNFADCEVAWTSFDRNARQFSSARNPGGISGKGRRIHICQKPVQLYQWIYRNFANAGERILDTHLGSGSSAIAAWEEGLEFTGIEINPDIFDKAAERIRKHIEERRV